MTSCTFFSPGRCDHFHPYVLPPAHDLCNLALLVMVWLWQSKTGLVNLDQALDHIVAVTWESAAVPSAFQIIAVSLYDSRSVRSLPEHYSTSQEHWLTITYAGLQGESHHLVLFFSLMTGKLYTLGILRSLNSRPDLRGRMTSDDVGRRSLSDWQWGNESENTITRRWSDVRLRIYLHLEVRIFWGTEIECSHRCCPSRQHCHRQLHRVHKGSTSCQKIVVRS